jgi:hypothetical protein
MLHISTKSQLADLFSKALPPKFINFFMFKPSMFNVYHASVALLVVGF